jgi:hypothetical protein
MARGDDGTALLRWSVRAYLLLACGAILYLLLRWHGV